MPKYPQFQKLLHQIRILKSPQRRLSTFGVSKLDYTLVTDVPGFPDRAKLRMGHVMSDRPQIITAQNLREKFFGFGDEAEEMAKRLVSHYGDALKGLEYQFHNEALATRIELATPDQITKDLIKDFDRENTGRKALIRGMENVWQLSIMKFIVEETLASFGSNVQELQERGFFDGEDYQIKKQHHEIQVLFKAAQRNKVLVPTLGKKLKEHGLFEQYQDEFFNLTRG